MMLAKHLLGPYWEYERTGTIVTVDGVSFKTIKALCAYLKRAESEDRRIRLVTRARAWDYMSASKYNLYEVKIDGVKLVGPKLEGSGTCL